MATRLPSRPLDGYDNDLALIVRDDAFMRDLHVIMDERVDDAQRESRHNLNVVHHFVMPVLAEHEHCFAIPHEGVTGFTYSCECGSSSR